MTGEPAAALEVAGLSVRLGRHLAVSDVSAVVEAGTVLGVVGPNGAGKTTLVDAVSGFVASTGAVRLEGREVNRLPPHRRAALGLARTFQTLELFEDLTVGENLAAATAGDRGGRAVAAPGLDDVLDRLPADLSPGQRKELALARALAGGPGVLLLDEPAAGLGGAERAALAARLGELAAEGLAVVVVDHDVGLVLEVSDDVLVLDGGRLLAHGPPAQVRADPAVRDLFAGFAGSGAGAGSRPARELATPSSAPLLAATGMTVGYGGAAVVVDVDLSVGEGEVVALVGANGAGKTTTLRAVGGLLPLSDGEVSVMGRPVVGRPERVARRGVATATQDRGLLPGLTVAEQLRLAARGGRRQAVEAALDRFPSLRPLLSRRAGRLSGGEAQLLSLARALASAPRLLLVDELSLGLAAQAARHALGVLRAVADEGGTGVLVVEQFAAFVLSVADRGYLLDGGRVVAEGSAAHLRSRPELSATALGGPPA